MPLLSRIAIESKSFNLLQCSCTLSQKFKPDGSPDSGVRGGMLDLILSGTEVDETFEKWISDPNMTKDGTIQFLKDPYDNNDSKIKEIKFEKAYLVALIESYVVEDQLDSLKRERNQSSELIGIFNLNN